ncbi:MAG: YbaB/EbfC family nucleoid-associated protein [Candidatus Peregrinibacteria bacterium]
MTSFSKLKDMFRLQREAKRVKKVLKKILVEAEARGVKVVINSELEILSVTIAPEVDRDQIADLLMDALNRAIKKAQIVASEHMQGVMGEMGFPTKD